MSVGLISFVNTETWEVDGMPREIYSDISLKEDDEGYGEETTDTCSDGIFSFQKWIDYITIEPMESSEAYHIMEYFVNYLPRGNMKDILNNAIIGKKPFANFNNFIHQSEYRDLWFEFKDMMHEKYLIDNYLNIISEKE